MKKLFALLIVILLVLSSGEVVRAQYNFPDNPALDQVATGPGGQQFKWDGVKWVALLGTGGGGGGLTFVGPTPPPSPPVGQLWFDTTNLQTYLWYNDGTSSQWVAVVNLMNGIPSGATIDSPTFTGTLNFPDGSTYTTAGHNSMRALGIGAAAPTAASGFLLNAEKDWNGSTALQISNTTTGTQAQTVLYFGNDNPSYYGAIGVTSSAFDIGNPAAQPPDTFNIITNMPSIVIAAGQMSGSISFAVGTPLGPEQVGSFVPHGLDLTNGVGRLQSIFMNGVALGNGLTSFVPLVTGQCGGTCVATNNNGWASRVGNLVTVNVTGGYTCTNMCGYLQFQGFPWTSSGISTGNTAICSVEAGNLPHTSGYTQFSAQVLAGWAGALLVETGSAVPAEYYFSNLAPPTEWTARMTCNYLTDY